MSQKRTKKQAQQKRRRRSITVRVLVLCVACYLVFMNIRDLGVLMDEIDERESKYAQKDSLALEIEQRKALLEESEHKKLIEKVARERYGYAYPGEEIFIDISGK